MDEDDDMFGHRERQDRAVVAERMRKGVEQIRALAHGETQRAEEIVRQRHAEFMKKANERLILEEWKRLGKEPVYSAGILMPPGLLESLNAMKKSDERKVAKHAERERQMDEAERARTQEG